jgi:hypothetical protein
MGVTMAVKRLVTPEIAKGKAAGRDIKRQNKGKPPNVWTPPEKEELLFAIAESLGFYDPTP